MLKPPFPYHVKIHFRKAPRPSDLGKRLFLLKKFEPGDITVGFFIFFAINVILLSVMNWGNGTAQWFAGLACFVSWFCVICMRFPKMACHENAIVIHYESLFLRNNGIIEKKNVFWLSECDFLESFDRVLHRNAPAKKRFSWRLVKDGEIVHTFSGTNYDLLEVGKIYTTANPNIESVENFGRRSECEWMR